MARLSREVLLDRTTNSGFVNSITANISTSECQKGEQKDKGREDLTNYTRM